MESHCRLTLFMLHYLQRLTDDLPNERLAEQPTPGVNHAAWILGHLAIAADYGIRLLGSEYTCSAEWHRIFAPGSKPQADRAHYPARDVLLTTTNQAYQELIRRAQAATPEMLAQTQPVDFLKPWLSTNGDFLGHLLTTHLASHLGQLSSWRRQCGFSPISL